jgi:hypothetical protein
VKGTGHDLGTGIAGCTEAANLGCCGCGSALRSTAAAGGSASAGGSIPCCFSSSITRPNFHRLIRSRNQNPQKVSPISPPKPLGETESQNLPRGLDQGAKNSSSWVAPNSGERIIKKSEGKEERHYEGIDSTKRIRGGDGERFRGVESEEICAADGFGREVEVEEGAVGQRSRRFVWSLPQIFEYQVLYSSLLYFPFLNQLLNFSPIENLFFYIEDRQFSPILAWENFLLVAVM